MSERLRKRIWPVTFLAVVILAATVICAGCRKNPDEQNQTQSHNPQPTQSDPVDPNTGRQIQDNPAIKNTENAVDNLTLIDIIKYRRSWNPINVSWYGKMAPDFTVTDLTGKEHKLSDYRGKDVLIILWASWCGPCIMEMPHLIELRKTIGEDKLAMLAISYITKMPPNTTEMVKKVAQQQKVNYTVISVDRGLIPAPYANIRGFPSSFFVGPEGKVKLATEGVISFGEIKAILQAEPLDMSAL